MLLEHVVAVIGFCLVFPALVAKGDQVFPVDDGNVTVKEFQFPGPIQQFWWVSGLEIVVRANGHLFLQRNYGSSGDWEDVTRGIDDFNANNSRVPGMGSVSNIRFPPKPPGVSQDILLVETLQSKTFIVTIEVPGTPMVIGPIAFDRLPPSWATEATATTTTTTATSGGGVAVSISGVFSDVEFHPTIPSVAVAILRDPSCRGRSLSCATAAYVTSVEITDLPFLKWSLVESDTSIMQAFFGSPTATAFSTDAFFVLTKPTERGALLDGQMFQVSLSAIAKAAATSTATASLLNPSVTAPILSSTFGAQTLGKFTVVAAATDERKIGLFITDNNFLTAPTHANFGTHIFPSDTHPYDEDLDEQETGYTLLSVTDEIFVNVYRASAGSTQTWGHTYVSGQSGHRFSLSLPYNRRLNRWNAAVDFHQVAGIEGVILANIVQNPDDESCRNCGTEEECDDECAFGTVISHDNGKSWQPVPPPAGACDDAASSIASCSLHLHSYSSSRMFNAHPVVSSKSAPGLIVATGNVGDFLDLRSEGMADANVYMSRDAGRSWVLVKHGPAIYGETDYGGVLYLLPNDRQARHLNFSVDEGATWSSAPVALPGQQYVFSSLLVPEAFPNAHFINVLAFLGNGGRNDVAIHVDFSNLKQRTCVNVDTPNDPSSDFELFQPMGFFDTLDGTSCFLGRSVSYARKKFGAKCWVAVPPADDGSVVPNFLLPKVANNCSCTKDDYECDVDYVESGENCVPLVEAAVELQNTGVVSTSTADIPVVPTPAESLCDSGQLVSVKTGYRKLGGDSCVGGLDLNPTTVPCPPSQQKHVAGYLALVALAASGVFLLIWQRARAVPEFAATVATVCFPLRCLFGGHVSDGNRYSTVLQEEREADVNDNADDESARETTALHSAREAAVPTRRAVATTDEAGEELKDAPPVVSAFSCPVTVKAHEDDVVPPTHVAVATVESPSTFFDAFSSLEPPPLPSSASPSGAPRAAPSSSGPRAGNLDFIDFGQ